MSVVEEATPTKDPPVPLRRNRDFLLLWSGAGASYLGTRVSTAAYPLLVLWFTNSPLTMSLVSFAGLLPTLLVQLPAGALVDRWDRKRVMIGCEAGRTLALASLAVAVVAGHVWVAHIAAVAFTESSLTVFYRLAERGAVRNVVHPQHLSLALSQNEARGRAAGLLGQPGGILLQSVARFAPFLFTAVAYFTSLCSLLLIRSRFQGERTQAQRKLAGEVAEGLRWLWRHRFLRAALGFVAGSNVLFQILALAIVLLIKDEGRSQATLAVIAASSGVGGVAGALAGGWWTRRLRQRTVLVGGAFCWAALMTGMGLVTDPFVLGALFAGASCVGAVFNVSAAVYQVRTTPDELQGRVAGTSNLIGSGTNSLGALIGGVLLQLWGAGHAIQVTGVVMTLLAVVSFLSPALKQEASYATAD